MLEMKHNSAHLPIYISYIPYACILKISLYCVFLFLVVIFEIKFASTELTDLCHERA